MWATGDRARRAQCEAGTTLIEALVTVTLMAMVGAIAFPAVHRGLSTVALQQAASGVRADLRMARAQALRTGEAVELTVDRDGRGYGWTPGPQRALLAGLALEPAGGRLRFEPDGTSDGGPLRLGDGRRAATFAVDPVIGVERGSP